MSADSIIIESSLTNQTGQSDNTTTDSRIVPPSSQPTFKTEYKSNSNRDGGIMTTQHSLTLENYSAIMRSEYYQHSKLSPPPLVYAKDKRILIELAKLFGLRHGYRIVINKNDSRRVILLCSRHGTNKVSSRSKREKPENSTFNGNLKSHKCQCPFRAEIQLKQRRKLWILKPINMQHNHDEILQLPITVDNTTSSTLPTETTDGGSINKKYTVSSFCDAENHLNCFFENNDFGKLLGFDESKQTIIHPDDGLKLITTELLNNNTLNDNTGNSINNSSTSNSTSSKRKQRRNTDNGNDDDDDNANEQQLATELLKVAKRARKNNNTSSNNTGNNNLKEQFTLLIKNSNPKNFFEDFPKFSINDGNLEFRFGVIGIDDPNFYNFQLLNGEDKILLNEDILSLNKDINEMTSQDLIKKITDIISTDAKIDQGDDDNDHHHHHQINHEEEEEVVVEEDPDIANITAVAVKAQQHAKDNDIFVDPELTK